MTGFVLAGSIGCASDAPTEVALGAASVPGGVAITMAAVTEGDRMAGGYLLASGGPQADQLVEVTSPAASRVSLHRTVGGSMQTASFFTVPANDALRLVPGGDHLMLEGLVSPLAPGATVPLRLRFASGEILDVSVPVVALVDVLDIYDGGW